MSVAWRHRSAMGLSLAAVIAVTVHCSRTTGEEDQDEEQEKSEADADADDARGAGGGEENTLPPNEGGADSVDPRPNDEPAVCGISPSKLPPSVPATPSSEQAPTEGTGGEVSPGTYILTQWIHYPSNTPPEHVAESMSAIMVLHADGKGQRILDWDGESFFSAFEWLTTGDYFGFNFSCPEEISGEGHAEHYSAEGNELIFYTDNKWAEVYTRQAP